MRISKHLEPDFGYWPRYLPEPPDPDDWDFFFWILLALIIALVAW